MLNIELIIGIAIFALGLFALIRDYKFFIYLLLTSSVLIHKELFSLYLWDLMPIRFLMLALSTYVLGAFAKHLIKLKRTNSSVPASQKITSYLSDPFVLSLSFLWVVRGISIIFTQDMRSSLELYAFFTSIYLASLFLYIRLKSRPAQILKYLDFYLVLVGFLCLFGFMQLFLNASYDLTVGAFWAVPGHIPRVGSLFWDVNHFGAFIASLFLYGVARFFSASNTKARFAYLLLVAPIPVILYLTNSRTSMMLLFAAAGIFVFMLMFKKIGKYAFIVTLLGVLFVSLSSFYLYSMENSRFREVVRQNLHYRIDSFDSHFLLLAGASEVFSEHPILGGGYGSFFAQFMQTKISSEYLRRDPAGLITKVPAHTIWGEVAAETGIIGFAAFVLFCLLITAMPFYNFLQSRSYKDYLVHAAIFSSILGYFMAGIFYSYNSEFFWLVIVLYATYSIGKYVQLAQTEFTLARFKNTLDFIEYKFNAGFVILAIFSFALIFLGLSSNALITWDESIYAKIAKNVLTAKNFAVLTWKDSSPWFEKPPLYFWVTAFFMKIFGANEFSVRLFPALSGFGTIMTVTYFAKKVFGRSVGYLSGFILLTTFQFLYYSRIGMLDVILSLFITLAVTTYFLLNRSKKAMILAGIFIGLAVLTKGIVGFLPLVIIFIYDLVTLEEKQKLSAFKSFFVLFISSAVIFLPWHLYMYMLYGKQFYESYIIYHVLQRASTAIEGKGQPFWWYFVVAKVSMRIWFIALLGAIPFSIVVVLFRQKLTRFYMYITARESQGLILLLIWFSLIFVFFSSAVSKLIWYIIPLYIPASILTAFFIVVGLRAVFSQVKKSQSDNLVFVSIFGLITLMSGYFYIERGRVYTEDYNMSQAYVIKAANKYFPTQILLVDRIDTPVTYFYRDGDFVEHDFQDIRRVIRDSTGETVAFITNQKRFKQLNVEFPAIKLIEQSGDFVLAQYIKP